MIIENSNKVLDLKHPVSYHEKHNDILKAQSYHIFCLSNKVPL